MKGTVSWSSLPRKGVLRFLPTRRGVQAAARLREQAVLHDELAEREAEVDGRRELMDEVVLVAADERVEEEDGGHHPVDEDGAHALLDLLRDLPPVVGERAVLREELVEVDRHHEQRVRDGARAEVAPLDGAVEGGDEARVPADRVEDEHAREDVEDAVHRHGLKEGLARSSGEQLARGAVLRLDRAAVMVARSASYAMCDRLPSARPCSG